MQTTPLSEVEREVIEDIKAVCARCGLPADLRPTFKAYRRRGGRFDAALIAVMGGWIALCEKGGMRRRTLKRKRDLGPEVDLETLVADVRRVAEERGVKQGRPLPRWAYHRWGFHGAGAINKHGGWEKVSAAAGVPSTGGGNSQGPRYRKWHKTRSDLTAAEEIQILDRALDRPPAPRGILRMVGMNRRHGPHKPMKRPVLVVERDEVIADIRAVAMSLGLSSFRELSFATYREHGGQYSYEQTAAVGGFDSLCRAGRG